MYENIHAKNDHLYAHSNASSKSAYDVLLDGKTETLTHWAKM